MSMRTYHYAWLLELLSRDEEALRHGDYTKELNPLSPFYTAWLAEQYADAGQHERAIKEAKETLDLNPTYPVAWLTLGNAYLDLGRYDEAVTAHEHLRDSDFWGWALTATLAERGRQEDARLIAENIASNTNNAFTLALTYCSLRDRDVCISHMETARENRHPWFPWLVAWFRPMKVLHDDPRMQGIRGRSRHHFTEPQLRPCSGARAPAAANDVDTFCTLHACLRKSTESTT